MRSSHSPSWLNRNQPSLDTHHHQLVDQVPLSSTFVSPRPAPKAPTFKNSTLKSFQSVFQRKPPPSPSLHSSESLIHIPDNHNHHPYAVMPPPLPVVSNHDALDDEQECPVCLEPLSFSFRLPGEKPHVVPECGHSLHEVSSQIDQLSSFVSLTFSRLVSPPCTVLRQTNLGPSSLASPTWACAACAGAP